MSMNCRVSDHITSGFQGLYAMSMNCMEAAEGQFKTAITVRQTTEK